MRQGSGKGPLMRDGRSSGAPSGIGAPAGSAAPGMGRAGGPRSRFYSARSAWTGSTAAARRAGIQLASVATAVSTAAAAT